jgi:hypothetical protein
MTKDEHIQKALDTLAELCDVTREQADDSVYQRRSAAEEILRHYREGRMFEEGVTVNLHIDGHVPVRPVQKAAQA